jgi:ribosomal protein S18 acetylase RimI-like enzyme
MKESGRVTGFAVRAIRDEDRPAVTRLVREFWGADVVVGHGRVFRPAELPGFLVEGGDGLLTYEVRGGTLEIVTINAVDGRRGIGTALVEAAVDAARAHGCTEVRVTTTNDNVDALRFYQRRGFRLVELRPGALARSRELKPEIPELGAYGIPLRDELELVREITHGAMN